MPGSFEPTPIAPKWKWICVNWPDASHPAV